MTTSLLLLLLAASPAAGSDAVVARANGEAIRAAEVKGRIMAGARQGARMTPSAAVDELVADVLLARAARQEGLAGAPEVKKRVAAERRKAAAQRLLETEVGAKVSVTDDQVKALYHAQEDKARFGFVLRPTAVEAQAVADRLARGGKIADELPKSAPGAHPQGADVAWAPRAEVPPDLVEAVFTGAVGKPSAPIPMLGSFAVVLVQERSAADEAQLGAAKERLRTAALSRARDDATVAFMAKLRQERGAKVDAKALAKLSAVAKPSQKELGTIVASARGVKIKYAEVAQALQAAHGSTKAGAPVVERLVNTMLDRAVLEQAAIERGHDKAPEVAAAVPPAERSALAELYAARLRSAAAPPTDADVEAYYQQHRQEFDVPAARPCWHVLSRTEDEAKKARTRLAAGEPFAAVAKESVDAPSAARGGLIGDVPDDVLSAMDAAGDSALANAVRKLAPGELSAPVKSRSGWHVLRCEAKKSAHVVPLAEAKPAILQRVLADRQATAVRLRVAQLRKDATVFIDEAAVGKVSAH